MLSFSRHPSEHSLTLLVAGRLDGDERKHAVAHLLDGCPSCSAFTGAILDRAQAFAPAPAAEPFPSPTLLRLAPEPSETDPAFPAGHPGVACWNDDDTATEYPQTPTSAAMAAEAAAAALRSDPLSPQADPRAIYDRAFALSRERAIRLLADRSRRRLLATALWAELEPRLQRQRLLLIDRQPRFHQLPLLEHLLEVAAEASWREPTATLEVADLALAIAAHLPADEFAGGLLFDLQARALCHKADACRLTGDLAAADSAIASAWRALARGTGDRIESAHLLRLEATCRLHLGRLEHALILLRLAARLCRRARDRHHEGCCRLQMALAEGYLNPPLGALLARQALSLLDLRRDRRLELLARHARIWFINDSGRGRRALLLLEETRPLYQQQAPGCQPCLHRRWLEGRINRNLGHLDAAEQTFKAVWREFREAGFNQDETLVCLDLAEVYLARGKTRQALILLRIFHSTLRLWKMHPPGLAAWLLLRQTVATEAARSALLLREAALYYRQSWWRPDPFHNPTTPQES